MAGIGLQKAAVIAGIAALTFIVIKWAAANNAAAAKLFG